MAQQEEYDVLIVGGGPAGLSAALYLARYDRRVALFDTGQGRSTWHQVNHNYLGFPGGVSARRLRALARQQLAEYEQVVVREHKVEELRRGDDGFLAGGQARTWFGRAVIVCTGVLDHYPHFERWEEYVGRSMFWCITCDGYSCRGARVMVAGNTNDAACEALQLTRFTDQLTLLTDSHRCDIDERFEERLRHAGIPLVHDRIERVDGADGQFERLYTQQGHCIELDQLFCLHGATPLSDLAGQLGAERDAAGYIIVDGEQKTNVAGLFAAGDVTRRLAQQVSTAVHEGGQAALAANYYLYPPELKLNSE